MTGRSNRSSAGAAVGASRWAVWGQQQAVVVAAAGADDLAAEPDILLHAVERAAGEYLAAFLPRQHR